MQKIRLTPEVYAQVVDLAAMQERTIEAQAIWLLRQALEAEEAARVNTPPAPLAPLALSLAGPPRPVV